MKARVISTKPKGKAVVLFYDCSNHQNSYINWNPHNIFETHDLVLNLTHTWNVKCAWRNLGNNKINKKNCRTFLIHIIINSRNCVKNVLTNCDVLNKNRRRQLIIFGQRRLQQCTKIKGLQDERFLNLLLCVQQIWTILC